MRKPRHKAVMQRVQGTQFTMELETGPSIDFTKKSSQYEDRVPFNK